MEEGGENLYFRRTFASQFQADKMDLHILKADIGAKYSQTGEMNLVHNCGDTGFMSAVGRLVIQALCILSFRRLYLN